MNNFVYYSPKEPLPPDITEVPGKPLVYTAALVAAAVQSGCEVWWNKEAHLVLFKRDGRTIASPGFTFPLNTIGAAHIARSKALTKMIWQHNKIPCVDGYTLSKKDFLANPTTATNTTVFPCVVKPSSDTYGGEGVVTNIPDSTTLHKVLQTSFEKYPTMLIEHYVGGMSEYRVVMLDGKVLGLSQKHAPFVVGDGKKTIEQLVAEKNIVRKEVYGPFDFGLIPHSIEVAQYMEKVGCAWDTVLPEGKRQTLSNVKNLGMGGEPENITTPLPPTTLELCKQAVATIGLRVCGLDILSPNILHEPFEGVFLEANELPGYAMQYGADVTHRQVMYTQLINALFS